MGSRDAETAPHLGSGSRPDNWQQIFALGENGATDNMTWPVLSRNALNLDFETNPYLCKSHGSWNLLDKSNYFSWCLLDRYFTALPNLLLFISLARSISLMRFKPVKFSNSKKWDYYAKMSLIAVQIVTWLAFETLIRGDGTSVQESLDYFLPSTAVISLATLVLAGVTHYVEADRVIVPSDALLWYWLVSVVTNFLKIFSFVSSGHTNTWSFILQCFMFCESAFIMYLEWWIPKTRIRNVKASMMTADAFSRAFMLWLNPFITYASHNEIKERDLPETEEGFNVPDLSEKLRVSWENTGKSSWLSLGRAILGAFGSVLISVITGDLVGDACSYIQPFILRRLIGFVNSYGTDKQQPAVVGVYICFIIFFLSFLKTYGENTSWINSIRIFTGVNGSLYGMIYRKCMVMSPHSREQFPNAKIMNFVTVDLNEITYTFMTISNLLTAPVQLILCLYSLFVFLGPSFIAGLLALLISVPVNTVISRRMNKAFREIMEMKDKRIKFTTNLFTNAKSLKLYGWEEAYLAKLMSVRNDEELPRVQRNRINSVFMSAMFQIQPYLVASSVFLTYIYFSGRPLTAEVIFPCLILFNLLSSSLTVIPDAIMNILQSKVAFERIAGILKSPDEDLTKFFADMDDPAQEYGEPTVELKGVTSAWSDGDDGTIALENIDYTASKGDLCCVVGKVGSGKSAFLRTICGRLVIKKGTVKIRGPTAYVPQEPWLLNRSVKENILFESRFDPEFYQKTIEACALLPDIEQWPDGDDTEIGEKGVSLSGGQKARVSLARAVYSRADVYILDDVLSAVDEHVASHLIAELLSPNGLLASKTIILATNNIKVLSEATSIIMLEQKAIRERGSLPEVMAAQNSIYKLIKEFGKKNQEEALEDSSSDEVSFKDEYRGSRRRSSKESLRRASDASLKSISEEVSKNFKKTQKVAELNETGSVNKRLFLWYLRAGGFKLAILSISILFLSCALNTFSSIWLKEWSDSGASTGDSALRYLAVYFGIGVAYTLLDTLKQVLYPVILAIRASRKIHNDLARAVLRCPMSFFETTPLGRILNRFTGDMAEIDAQMVWSVVQFSTLLIQLGFAVLIIFYSTPYVLASILPVSVLYWYYQQHYMKTSRQTKRITSSTKSPMLAHMDESLKGVDVIKAYSKAGHFTHMCELHAELQLKAIFTSQSVDRWLGMRLNLMGAFIGLCTSTSAVYMTTQGKMSPGLVGLVMANAMQITNFMSRIVKQTVILERRGVALERIHQYTNLPSEGPEYVDGNRPAAYWPNHGDIKFENYSVRYRKNLDLVLKNINLHIKPREKIGIVGRTGAGKSTLTVALFRLIEPAAGAIIVDDVNTSNIGLMDLRQNLSIIPQDAQIFSGSIKDNLDPLGNHTDEKLHRVLELCHLKEHTEAIGGLDAKLAEGGTNLSKGQAQLMCLARALLHHSSVLVLDEATASVDVETDKIIQQTIRSEFKDKTIVTVAHRLNTIMDSDRIVVLEKGEVAEFDTPSNLLANKNSLFYALCEKGGFV